MMSSSNVSLSTGSFQNQAATVDALETASVPKTDGVKRQKRDMSVLLEQASSSEGVSSSEDHAARRQMINCAHYSCQENLPKAKLRAQQAAF